MYKLDSCHFVPDCVSMFSRTVWLRSDWLGLDWKAYRLNLDSVFSIHVQKHGIVLIRFTGGALFVPQNNLCLRKHFLVTRIFILK